MSYATQTVSQLTAPTVTVDAANSVTHAYRRSAGATTAGRSSCSSSTSGNLDNCDPVLVDTLAAHVLLNNTGVEVSSGKVPVTLTEMARDAIAFVGRFGDRPGRPAGLPPAA